MQQLTRQLVRHLQKTSEDGLRFDKSEILIHSFEANPSFNVIDRQTLATICQPTLQQSTLK